jgi:hypothetical protein
MAANAGSARGRGPVLPGRQKGASMVELSLFLTLYLGLVTMVFGVYGNVSDETNVKAASTQVSRVMGRFRDYGYSTAGYTDGRNVPDNATAIGLGLIPAEYLAPGNEIHSPWKTDIGVAATPAQLTLTVADVPSGDCSNFVVGLESEASQVTVGGVVVMNKNAGALLARDALANACAADQTPDVVVLYR